jgi:hypothetical protein
VKQIAENLKDAKIKTIEDWESKLRSALLKGIAEEQKYAEEVKRLQADLALAQMSTEEKLRELRRRTMTEEQAWNDQRKQAYETLKRAQEALSEATTPEGLQAAKDLAQKAQQQFSELAGEVKEGDRVIKTEAQTVQEAVKGVQAAGEVLSQAIEAQISAAETNRKNWQTTNEEIQSGLDGVKGKMDVINATPLTPTAEFKVESSAVDAKLQELNSTVTHSTHIIHVQTVQEQHTGGPVLALHSGGRPSGLGPGEVLIKALTTEYMLQPKATAFWGYPILNLFNKGREGFEQAIAAITAKFRIPSFHIGGAISDALVASMPSIPRSSSGGNYGTLRLQAGGVELPVIVQGSGGRQMVKDFERELSRLKLTRGR